MRNRISNNVPVENDDKTFVYPQKEKHECKQPKDLKYKPSDADIEQIKKDFAFLKSFLK